jgi:hypothetical protein
MFAPINEKKLFFLDQRSEAGSTRGFLTPTLSYHMKNNVSSEESSQTIEEKITCHDGDGQPAELSFKINFLYKNFSFNAELKDSKTQVFKVMNPLLYHEYWYRPFTCSGDFFVITYDAQHKYKASIEHFYTTYLPNEAYTTQNLDLLNIQRQNIRFELQSTDPFNSVTKLKTGRIRMNLHTGSEVPKKLMIFFELGIMKYLAVEDPIPKSQLLSQTPGDQAYAAAIMTDLSTFKIRVDRFRVEENLNLIFVSSTESSVGYLLHFIPGQNNIRLRVRKMEGINSDHLLSEKGLFNMRGYSEI